MPDFPAHRLSVAPMMDGIDLPKYTIHFNVLRRVEKGG